MWQQHAHSPRLAIALLRTADMLLAETDIGHRDQACLGAHWLPRSVQHPLRQLAGTCTSVCLNSTCCWQCGMVTAAAPMGLQGCVTETLRRQSTLPFLMDLGLQISTGADWITSAETSWHQGVCHLKGSAQQRRP